MSKKSDGLLADMLDNRWSATDVKTNQALTTAQITDTQSAKEVRHLDFFNLLILNKNTANHTVAAQVRDATTNGTVLAQWSLLVGASQVAQVSPANIHLIASPGKGLYVTLDTVAPSVTASVNIGGWTDQSTTH
jgi:hypothetical protein